MDDNDPSSSTKHPVVRGARACTVCRAAKMKCVGAEDGQKQCQRCKRAGVACVFEKHRRGRKPGSKLSEASKMLRKLEKGLTSAKIKSQAAQASLTSPYSPSDSRSGLSADGQFQLPPLRVPTYNGGPSNSSYHSRNGIHSPSMDLDEDEDDEDEDGDHAEEGMYPAKLIGKESQRNSFFGTVLGPSGSSSISGHRISGLNSAQDRSSYAPGGHPVHNTIPDPIIAGYMDEDTAKILFDSLFLRLNPFINLFDPELHSVNYVRKKSPFLFSTLLMAGSKFWKPEVYSQCYKLAHDLAVRAFADQWKGVEVVQAFACLTYWKEPDDKHTWTYIGYACRMAVELGLNRYVSRPPDHETVVQRLERRNRERTYLVLFVHDRSLSMQTGRQWMLPEDDLVRNSSTWHEQVPPGATIRAEDVILSAFVALRKIAGETTDLFSLHKDASGPPTTAADNYEVLLRGCNAKLAQWQSTWKNEMTRANGHLFHFSFLQFFSLYVRLFLNSYGIQNSMTNSSRAAPSLQALSQCHASATESLRIVTNEFARVQVLQYAQDSVTIMTAYSSVFLLKLLRSPSTAAHLPEGATEEIHSLITKTADAYQDAAAMASSSSSSAYHARFLRSLVMKDKDLKARHAERERRENVAIDPILQDEHHAYGKYRASNSRPVSNTASTSTLSSGQNGLTPPQMYHPQPVTMAPHPSAEPVFRFPASPHLPAHPLASDVEVSRASTLHNGAAYAQNMQSQPHAMAPPSESDAHYWRNMFRELGFGGGTDTSTSNGDYAIYSAQGEGAYHPGMQS